MLKNGRRVTAARAWWERRRPEIVEEFDREVYGRALKKTPAVKWEVVSTTRETNGDVPVVVKKLLGRVDNSSYPHVKVDIDLTLTTPAEAAGPVPLMMKLSWVLPPNWRPPPGWTPPPGPTWQQQVGITGHLRYDKAATVAMAYDSRFRIGYISRNVSRDRRGLDRLYASG